MNLASTVTLNNRIKMPWLGLGVYLSEAGNETVEAVTTAIETGYRHIDTAAFYGNEQSVAEGILKSGLDVEDVFVTTKLWNTDHGKKAALKAFDKSRKNLQRDVIDLYLMHWPMKDTFIETWGVMEELYANGKVRAIGVSNFLVHHIDQLLAECDVVPVVNQVECHPYLVQKDLRDYCDQLQIQFESWSPLGRGKCLEDTVIKDLASKYDKTPAQIIIRWNVQNRVVVIPKSKRRDRIKSNAQVFDFKLSDEEMAVIDALDRNERVGPHPDDFCGWM